MRNVASLDGTHTVDFTSEPLQSAGLFSISGKTGSGKSSLLDAMCLALYDATPRLEPVRRRLEEVAPGEKQGDPRSLLRRGCAEGMAEVAFEGADGQEWTSRWSVRRARRKADGKLQNVDMTLFRGHIAPGGDGAMEASGRKTEVLRAIEEKIGLTFRQFTRAVLLAQNDFATFLKSDDKARAEILQALTGTERFEEISKAVYERHATEKKSLQNLEARLEGMTFLSDDDRDALTAKLETQTANIKRLRKQFDETKTHAKWYEDLSAQQTKLTEAEQLLQAARQKFQNSKPRQQELLHTELVQLEARSLRDSYNKTAAALAAATKVQRAAGAELKTRQNALKKALEQQEATDELAAKKKTVHTDTQPLLVKARELDAKLEPADKQVRRAQQMRTKAETAAEASQKRLTAAQKKLDYLWAEQKELQQQHEDLRLFEPFAQAADQWRERLQAAINAQQAYTQAEKDFKEASENETKVEQSCLQAKKELQPLRKTVAEAGAAADKAAKIVDQYDVDQIAADREAKSTLRGVLSDLTHYLENLNQHQNTASRLSKQISALEQQVRTDSETIQKLETVEIPKAEGRWKGQQSLLDAITARISDEAKRLRTSLQHGQPCPVCGSEEHPYRHQSPDTESAAVETAQEEVANAHQDYQRLRGELADVQSAVRSGAELLNRHRGELAALKKQIDEANVPGEQDPAVQAILCLPAEKQSAELQKQLSQIETELQKIAADEKSQRTAAKELESCRRILQQQQSKLDLQESELDQQETALQVAKTRRDSESARVRAAGTVRSNAYLPLKELWTQVPNSESEFRTQPERYHQTFVEKAVACRNIQKRVAEIENSLKQVDAELKPLQESHHAAKQTLEQARRDEKQIVDERDILARERENVLNGQPADEVQKTVQAELDEVVAALEQATKHRIEAEKRLANAVVDESSKSDAKKQLQQDVEAAAQKVQEWLTAFCDHQQRTLTLEELDQMLARSPEWLKTERDALEQLKTDVQQTEGAKAELAKQLDQHRQSRLTEDSPEDIAAALEALTRQLNEAEEERDQINGSLHSDDLQRKTNAGLTTKIRKKQAEADPWLKLNDMIGSADGAKFRAIAQRQTLDILLGYANAHLRELSQRYRLERLADCLNLIVVDQHMAEERRSVHSLSGGESFLISLALALGLASLTSNRLQIESLFIDEGFGSLDPETLETAMSALMHLEAQGRKVGVISHVTEMTDAIPVQIKVVTGSNGAAKIVVPLHHGHA